MPIELPDQARKEAIASIERYLRENMEEKIGNVAASGLLGFFLEEVAPTRLLRMYRNACKCESQSWTSRFMKKSSSTGASTSARAGHASESAAEPFVAPDGLQRASPASVRG